MTRGGRAGLICRWIALAPAAALAALVTPALVKYVNRLSLYAAGFDPDSVVGRIYIESFAGLATGAAFVYVGARVAPAHRRSVAIALAAIALFLTGAAALGDVAAAYYWLAWQGGCAAVGACVTAYSVVRGEILPLPASPAAVSQTVAEFDNTGPPPTAVPSPAEAPSPLVPEISSPKPGERLKAAISLGSQMAEVEALWALQERARQVRPNTAVASAGKPIDQHAWTAGAGRADPAEFLAKVAMVVTVLAPALFVLDTPSLMLLNRIRFPRWLFALLMVRAFGSGSRP